MRFSFWFTHTAFMVFITLKCKFTIPNVLKRILTLNSVTVLYSLFLILSFMVLKSMGCLMIIEYPGAIASVTGNEKNPWGSFLWRQVKQHRCDETIQCNTSVRSRLHLTFWRNCHREVMPGQLYAGWSLCSMILPVLWSNKTNNIIMWSALHFDQMVGKCTQQAWHKSNQMVNADSPNIPSSSSVFKNNPLCCEVFGDWCHF